jgi:DNA (cytosine-5)-methyltransferase 1
MIKTIKFLDFCSGIGGGRIGLENLGMKCLVDKEEITYREFLKAKGNHK